MEKAQNELRALLPQKFHIPSSQLRLLNSIGHGTVTFKYHLTDWLCITYNSVCGYILSPGEFGEVYKAHLIKWTGEGKPRTVAVKTLRGLV